MHRRGMSWPNRGGWRPRITNEREARRGMPRRAFFGGTMGQQIGLLGARDVAVLYVDRDGPYPLLAREWFDEARDAGAYAGPHPIVAHPPCGPWGMLRHLSERQDASAGPRAVELVRRWGGVHDRGEPMRLGARREKADVALHRRCRTRRAPCDASASRADPLGERIEERSARSSPGRDQGVLRGATTTDARGLCSLAPRAREPRCYSGVIATPVHHARFVVA